MRHYKVAYTHARFDLESDPENPRRRAQEVTALGTTREMLTVYAHLSNHNTEQDEADEAAWRDLVTKIRDLANRPEYDKIEVSVHADT